MAGIAGERKEVIAQAVDVFDDGGFHFLSFHFQSYAAALGAAAYAACDMQLGYRGMSARQDKVLHGGQGFRHPVDLLFQVMEVCYPSGREYAFWAPLMGSQARAEADGEEAILHFLQYRPAGLIR